MTKPCASGRPATRVLFVDDEPNILQSLRRALHGHTGKWQMRFVGKASEALEVLTREPFDVVVSDLQMPGMDGIQLLSTVQTRWPALLRIISSGSCERHSAVEAARVAHQFLAKPYTTSTLEDTVDRAIRLRHLLQDDALAQLVSGLDRLPTLPDNYTRLTEALRDPSRSLQQIGELVAADAALTAKVLQVVNSAFFALPRRVTSAGEAALFLGIEVLQALVLATDTFGALDADDDVAAHVRELWSHSMEIAARTRVVGKALGATRQAVDGAFMAGLMHEIGGLILCQNRRDDYLAWQAAVAAGDDSDGVDQRIFGTTRARIAAYLLGTWGLPDEVVGAVAFHRQPAAGNEQGLGPLAVLHLAHGLSPGGRRGLDQGYVDRLGLGARLDHVERAIVDAARAAAST